MKFLDFPAFAELSRQLTFESPECKVFTRLEAYSCKAVKRERQIFKSLESQYLESASISPPSHLDEMLASPFGRLDQLAARKTMFMLIATLNAAFPDHDFTDVNPADFRREPSSDSVLSSLGTTLLSLRSSSNAPRSFSSYPSGYDGDKADKAVKQEQGSYGPFGGRGSPPQNGSINHPRMASVLDDIMKISDCEVYTFHPDADSDPHACAEPEEEGDVMDDDRYADDEGDATDDELAASWGDIDSKSSMGHRHRAPSYDRGSNDDDDAPVFDEDLLGSGFTPMHSRASSVATTPRTPSASLRSRAGDYFVGKAGRTPQQQRDGSRAMSASMPAAFARGAQTGFELDNDDAMYDGDVVDESGLDDDDSGLHGLLWATYAFFYNRKLKRVLFVSVWSRRNSAHKPVSYSFSPPSYPTLKGTQASSFVPEKHVPALSLDGAVAAQRRDMIDLTEGQTPSPAKRAIARSAGGAPRGRGRQGGRTSEGSRGARSASGSPAPSALSPFPHDAPRSSQEGTPRASRDQSKSAAPIAVRSPAASTQKQVRPRQSRDGDLNAAARSANQASSPASDVASGAASSFSSSSIKRTGDVIHADGREVAAGSAQKQRRT